MTLLKVNLVLWKGVSLEAEVLCVVTQMSNMGSSNVSVPMSACFNPQTEAPSLGVRTQGQIACPFALIHLWTLEYNLLSLRCARISFKT